MIERLEQIIFYFEGTCEICLANRGIERYRKEVDGYIQSLEKHSDETRLRILYASAVIEYKLDNHEKAYEEWQKALIYARKVNNLLYIGKIYSFLAIYYYIKKDTEQEHYYFREAEKIFYKHEDYGELANHYINILWFKRYDKDTKEVIEYLDKALKNVRISDSKKNARVYLHLGYIYKSIFHDDIRGIQYLIKSIELSRENEFIEMESMTLHILADGYSKIDKPSETLKIYTAILQEERYQKITANLKAAVLCNLINCQLKMGKHGEATDSLSTLEKVLPEVQVNIRETYYAIMLGLKAELFSLQKVHLDKALAMVQESEQIYEKYKGSFIVDDFHMITYCRIGDIYFAMGNYHEAIRYYHLMQEEVSDDNLYYSKMAYERLAKGYEELGEYSMALHALKDCDNKLNEARKKKIDEQFETMHRHFVWSESQKEIARLSELNACFEADCMIDSLTGLYNRSCLNQYSPQKTSDADGTNLLSILLIDIDNFKEYNDHYGHDMGDMALIKVAAVLKKSCSGYSEKIYRYGGEEFLIILEHLDRKSAVVLAEKVLENMAAEHLKHEYSGVKDYITVSIGISTCLPGIHCDIQKLIEAADQAMYCSKKGGKNRFSHADCFYR